MDKVVLAFSGGLDTSVCVKLLEEKYDMEVITACVDVGQPEDEIKRPEEAAKKIGSAKHFTIDAKDEFAKDYAFRCIKTNALYEGYPLSTAFARPLIAKKIVEIAKQEGATTIAHGCTGKGNDQFRFEATIRSESDLDIVAPVRDYNLTRTEEQNYAREHGIPLPSEKIYSIDENLWGRSIEGGLLENPATAAPEDIYAWTKSTTEAPDTPQIVKIEFVNGEPVKIDDEELAPVALIRKANEIAGNNGIGRIDMIEDRIIGLKSRENYETPGALLLITAHQALEKLIFSREEIKFSEKISQKYAELVYNGHWNEPLREDLDVINDHMQRRVTGTVEVRLHKGSMKVITKESPFALYNEENVSFDDKGIDQREMIGMVKYHDIQGAEYSKVNKE
ncbi:argininosuccinate synthase [Candidatus Methanosphaera massiliense]|jgi:argininosuccinate synthase|uniref:argininosuccinate synthase n=1 Tax=Methanosphaera TaxID=2316 RepID=UPI000DC37F0F|nr:argininosuccinate synthase [Candidatus Methanosphaera massiliense]MDD6285985.1 argininosuccinate synthase [Methanobacteriaceae archaeon]MDE4077849.1 argininosuccinate synthase [Candidatus Methanosphaera massiliense]RAP43868.1 MAG: argininosuccinate synthase [Methanosphaera sp. SHI1033]